MSISERALMEAELADIVEGEFAYPIKVTTQDGVSRELFGHVNFDARKEQSTSNGPIIVNEMVVTLRRTSCQDRLLFPQQGDRVEMLIPRDPYTGALRYSYICENSKAPEAGRTIGTIRLYPKKAQQS